jgi:hypothetical protein
MAQLLYKVGGAICALALLGFTGQANATPRPMQDNAFNLTVLAADEENSEVENELDPAEDNGTPADAGHEKPAPEGHEGYDSHEGYHGGYEGEHAEPHASHTPDYEPEHESGDHY